MDQPPLLSVEQLHLDVDGRSLVSDFDVTLTTSLFVTLHGPSGSGKSTLLRAIAGLIEIDAGLIRLEGQSPAVVGWPTFRRRVIYVHQKPTLGEGTVASNLQRPFQYATSDREFDSEQAVTLLERLHVKATSLQQAALSLSVGQQQRVCLVRALLLEPAVLLLDEPTSALDDDAADAVINLLTEYRDQRGLSAIIATHDQSKIDEQCGRRIELPLTRAAQELG